MDNLTHGLMGLAVAALRRPDGGPGTDLPGSATDRAVFWAALMAAELPDLDIFYGGSDPLAGFKYHRGLTHALVFAPVVALVATVLVKGVFRSARLRPVYGFSLLAVLLAHLTNDLWTGWGTMLLQPFSAVRLGADWVNIIDPLITLPLLAAALLGWRRPALRRRALQGALLAVVLYVGLRGAVHSVLLRQVAARYPQADRTAVWPGMNPLGTWSYAVTLTGEHVTGTAGPGLITEDRRLPAPDAADPAVAAALAAPELQALFRFTAFPIVTAQPAAAGARLTVRDAKYTYFGFAIDLNTAGQITGIEPLREPYGRGH